MPGERIGEKSAAYVVRDLYLGLLILSKSGRGTVTLHRFFRHMRPNDIDPAGEAC
jgi:hypothetical protein